MRAYAIGWIATAGLALFIHAVQSGLPGIMASCRMPARSLVRPEAGHSKIASTSPT